MPNSSQPPFALLSELLAWWFAIASQHRILIVNGDFDSPVRAKISDNDSGLACAWLTKPIRQLAARAGHYAGVVGRVDGVGVDKLLQNQVFVML